MELHTAIRNILQSQGQAFLTEPKMIHALLDYKAFESHPALKNMFRALHADGYVEKIAQCKTWDMSCDQIVYDVERDYAFPIDLVEYILKSVAYGVGTLQSVSFPNSNNQPQSSPSKPKPQPTQSQGNPSKPQPQPAKPKSRPSKPWHKLSIEEREKFLNSLVEIKPSNCGLHYDSVYLADNFIDNDKYYCLFNYEVSGILPKEKYVEFSLAIYDTDNRLRYKNSCGAEFDETKNKHVHKVERGSIIINFDPYKISRIVVFMQTD